MQSRQKDVPGVWFFFFIQKAQSPLLKQFNHLYLYILGLLGCMFVLKDCY